MDVSEQPPSGTVHLVVTNFSGGKRHTAQSLVGDDGFPELAELTRSLRIDGGVVLAIQEMTSDEPGLPTRASALEQALGAGVRSTYLARVSTAWYPLPEKWGSRTGPGAAQSEGLCVATSDEGLALMPWSALDGTATSDSPMRVLDLPAYGFPEESVPRPEEADDWLQVRVPSAAGERDIYFRDEPYEGNRNSDPRAAQACLLAWGGAPACILINVHLSTLKRESVEGTPARVPTPEASFLRGQQLKSIVRKVRQLRDRHGLPVIVAGDFNAEPDSPEMLAFAADAGAVPLLRADVCWRCGSRQEKRPLVPFYLRGGEGLHVVADAIEGEPAFWTEAVCSNDECREPRFTHKTNHQLIDNVFIARPAAGAKWTVVVGTPRIDLRWKYSDHAAVIVPLRVARDDSGL